MNKKTKALTTEQYKEIITTMKEGFCGCRPNERIATALVLEGNLGLRISDILRLRPADIVLDGDRYRLEITEQKTGKAASSLCHWSSSNTSRTIVCATASSGMTACFRSRRGRSKSSLQLFATIWASRASAPTASASGTQRRFTRTTASTLPLSSGFCSTAPPPSRRGTSASSRSGSNRRLKVTRS